MKAKDLEKRVVVLERLCLLMLFGSPASVHPDIAHADELGISGEILGELSKTRFQGSCLRIGKETAESNMQIVERLIEKHTKERSQ